MDYLVGPNVSQVYLTEEDRGKFDQDRREEGSGTLEAEMRMMQ